MDKTSLLRCPICKQDLINYNRFLNCRNRHTFDFAKEGYVNLLKVDKKHSLYPGDNVNQVRARRDFLNKGYFDLLLHNIKLMLQNKNGVLLDAGCGTGYYLNSLKNCFTCIGVDISKEAIRIASKSTKELCIVSSIFDLPLKDNCIDVILSVFAPKPIDEFKRVLKNDGYILEVIPNEYHMIELKEKLYNKSYLNDIEEKHLNGFTLLEQKYIKYQKKVIALDVNNFIQMTPYAFSGKKFCEDILVTFDFIIKLWKKNI